MRPTARLGLRALAAAAAAGATALLLAACQPTEPSVRYSGPGTVSIGVDGLATFTLACPGRQACSGRFRSQVGGVDGVLGSYTLAAGQARSHTVALTARQLELLPSGTSRPGQIRIDETRPVDLEPRVQTVTFRRTGAPGPETSFAYRERNWTPTALDTCPADLHRTYSVTGPDGKLYPTWHPATVTDPSTGTSCTFGHEHGDDPATSDIYTWVTDFLNASTAKGRGIPFGYVSEALDVYGPANGTPTRHEDNVGHKVIVANDVRLVTESPRGYLRDGAGAPISCDVLMKVHQGTHSGDALVNNAHELLYAARCTDGTEIISSTMTRFGNANEFNRSCDGTLVATAGSNLPAGDGGLRRLPDRTCIDRNVLVPSNQTSSIWALYEVWESVNEIRTPDGAVLASFDPWFGVRNPARAHAGGPNGSILDLVDVTDLVDAADGGTARGYPFDEVTYHEHETGSQLAKGDPLSPFDGAQRDFYLRSTTVSNAEGPTTWWTGPYGDGAVTSEGPGLVRQLIGATDNSVWPALERRSFNLERDYGHANGVHAPN